MSRCDNDDHTEVSHLVDLPQGRDQLQKMFSLFDTLPKADIPEAAFDRGLNNDRE